ncbi:MAG TPA: hypothetical protein VIQ30_18620 [Pseudonocardia sp.]
MRRFQHLSANPYKALIWMCLRTLDDPNPDRGIPPALWFADWPELATAIGWTVPTDVKAKDTMRNNVTKVCRELVAAGAIEKVPHPNRIDNAAYRIILQPSQDYIDARKEARAKQATKAGRDPGPVDNLLVLDFGTGDTGDTPRVGNQPGGQVGNQPGARVGNQPGGQVGNQPGPIKRNQEPTEEGGQERAQEVVQEKVDDDSTRRPQPPEGARPVDNPAAAAGWSGAIAKVQAAMAAATSTP